MPYIRLEEREDNRMYGPGKLNYLVTILIKDYISVHGASYSTYNDILGVLTAVQHELYRRKIAPYENDKIKENGDVY